jgi:hypothetical protein
MLLALEMAAQPVRLPIVPESFVAIASYARTPPTTRQYDQAQAVTNRMMQEMRQHREPRCPKHEYHYPTETVAQVYSYL